MLDAQKSKVTDYMRSSMDQSLVTSSWRKSESKACTILSQKIAKEKLDKPERQALMEVLGDEFVQKCFPQEQAKITEKWGVKKQQHLHQEMISFVTSTLELPPGGKGTKSKKNKFPELAAFRDEARNILDSDYESQSRKQQKTKKGKKERNSLEDTTLELLKYDSSMVKQYCSRLLTLSASLPDNLRLLLWLECLLAKEKVKNQSSGSFQKGKKKLVQLLRHKASSSPSFDASKVVKNAFQENPALKSYAENSRKPMEDVLTLYVKYTKKFTDSFVYLAVPLLQLHMPKKSKKLDDEEEIGNEYGGMDSDHLVTVTLMLEKVVRLYALGVDQIFDIAQKVIEAVEKQDSEFISHLKKTLSVNVPSSIKNFPSDILSTDKKRSQKMQEDLLDSKTDISEGLRNSITDPALFIRKWLYEGFVTILSPTAIMYIWDQLFLDSWSLQSIQDTCLCLLGLLKPWFLISQEYMHVLKVFLEEPGFLYTLDICKAIGHWRKRKKFTELGGLNRNIEEVAAPPPKPVTPLPPTPPPPKAFIPWVPYRKENARSMLPEKTKVDQPFDLYVDAVRLVPDNATIIKVTGKVLNLFIRQRDKSVKIQGLPVLNSFYRYPQFNIKQTVNRESLPANPDVVIMFRLYTVERHSKKQTVLGSCLFCPFSNKHAKQAMLRVGGHQIRLRHGIPDPDFTVEHMLASHMDNNPTVPGVTILIRVLPHQKDYVTAPDYETNVYRSEFAQPNSSEERLYKHYQESKDFSSTVRDVALQLSGTVSSNDESLMRMMTELLEKEGSGVEDFPYQRFVNYDQKAGMMVLVDKASGLPIFLEGRYLQCLVQCFPGEDTRVGNGKSQVKSFITEDLDLESTQRAPDWSDSPTLLKPEYDDRAYMLITLYGLRPRFDPTTQKLVDKDGKEPKFDLQHAIAWSIVPCFDKQAAFAGTHYVPLLRGRPSDDVIEKLGYLPFDYIIKKFKTTVKVFESASIEVVVWDGHFTNDECPALPVHTEYLYISPNPKKYMAAKNQKFGETVLQLLKSGMLKSSQYTQYQERLLECLREAFRNNLNRSLEAAGYSGLTP